uniref:Spondin domain-containing protein n=1 Tax=Alexandrium monilatum TaxID=311494 RepID=A0A7S4PXZ7_9DINO
MAWHLAMVSRPEMQSLVGSVAAGEALVSPPRSVRRTSWDTKVTADLAALGGVGGLIRAALQADGLYARFLEIVNNNYRRYADGTVSLNGEDNPFAPPPGLSASDDVPSPSADFTSCRRLSARRAIPGPAPTASPWQAPTAAPTLSPKAAPMPGPVPWPTSGPTPWPTPSTTPAPTPAPTPSPTLPPMMQTTLATCEGKETRYMLCRQPPCNNCDPVDCQVSAWSEWSDGDCTGLCVRQRGVARPNNECGRPCQVDIIETKRCATDCHEEVVCPKGTDCQWGDWTDWSGCSCTCGGGQKTRDRQIKVAPQGNGKKCPAKTTTEMVPCSTQPCGAVECIDGTWGDWGEWGICSATCGGGLQWRHRKVLTEASECGTAVEGNDRELRYCSPQSCTTDADCQFGVWTDWGACSCSCDGVMRRSRRINVYGRGNGLWCKGHTKEVAPCNNEPMLEGPAEGDGCTREEAPVDCQFSDWSAWSKCSVTCGSGQHTRERRVLTEAKNFGMACSGALSDTERCEMDPCVDSLPPSAKPCVWGTWQDWGSCDRCGGQKKRFRFILQMPKDGGAPCQPEASEETTECPRRCNTGVYCTWGDWRQVGECSVSCGVGQARRERSLVASSELPPPEDLRLYGALPEPALAAGGGAKPRSRARLLLGLAGGCLLTFAAQWSWDWADRRRQARRATNFLPASGLSRSEEEIPLVQQARQRGQRMPVDTADPDFG